MSDKPASYAKIVIVSIVVSAFVSTAFGFIAGFVAGQGAVGEALLASLPPVVRHGLGVDRAVTEPASGEQYSLPELRQQLNRPTQEDRVVNVVEKAAPAVVSIVVSRDVPIFERYMTTPQDDFISQFFQGFPGMDFGTPQYRQKGTEKQEVGAGTGFIVSADGFIVTNRHVVADVSADYTVILADERKFVAQVVARDTVNDIAVLKIEGADFPAVALGDSDGLKVGQSVVAIGYALGQFGNTVSVGIVSGLRRQITAGDSSGQAETLHDVIQTDAAINPGNSGGPLLNLLGEAIGVNVAIVQGSQNIGFSLPINDVRKVVDSVRETGKIVRPWLGVRFVMITPEIRAANSLTVSDGALVVRGETPTDLAVAPGSPADTAGIAENDIILEADGEKLTVSRPLNVVLGEHEVGDKISLKVLRRGVEMSVEILLAERPQI